MEEALVLKVETVSPHSDGGFVGDITSTGPRSVEAVLDGTTVDSGAGLPSVSFASHIVSHNDQLRSDSPLSFSKAEQSPGTNQVGESPHVGEDSRESSRTDRSASLRRSMALASGPLTGG